MNDITEAISLCSHSQFQISLSELFYLIQEICLPSSLKSFNKYENIRVSAENVKLKTRKTKNRKKKASHYEENQQANVNVNNPGAKTMVISPNSPYLRKFRSSVMGTYNEFETLRVPNVDVINEIFMNIIGFFFKKIHNTNYYVSHSLTFESFIEKFRRDGNEFMMEYLNSAKKMVFYLIFFKKYLFFQSFHKDEVFFLSIKTEYILSNGSNIIKYNIYLWF